MQHLTCGDKSRTLIYSMTLMQPHTQTCTNACTHAPHIQAERIQACMHTCCICGRGVSCSIGKSSLCCHKHSSQKCCAMKYASKLIRCIAIGGIEWESSFWIAWDSDRYDQRFWLCDGLNSEADEMSDGAGCREAKVYTPLNCCNGLNVSKLDG